MSRIVRIRRLTGALLISAGLLASVAGPVTAAQPGPGNLAIGISGADACELSIDFWWDSYPRTKTFTAVIEVEAIPLGAPVGNTHWLSGLGPGQLGSSGHITMWVQIADSVNANPGASWVVRVSLVPERGRPSTFAQSFRVPATC